MTISIIDNVRLDESRLNSIDVNKWESSTMLPEIGDVLCIVKSEYNGKISYVVHHISGTLTRVSIPFATLHEARDFSGIHRKVESVA